MANFKMEALSKELRNTEEVGLTFEDKMLKWDSAEDVKDIVEALHKTKVVNFLKLDGNSLGVEAAKAIGDALRRHPEMRKALWKNMFTGRLKTEIPAALQHLGNGLMLATAQLTVLDLSDNALGPNGMIGLEALLRSPVCFSLQELLLNNCGLGIEGGKMLSSALIDCYNSSVAAGTPLCLKTFITGRNRLENEGAKAIAKFFSMIKTLEMIAMPQNSIYAEGMAALAEGIRQNYNLKIINLNDNIMGAKGATSIADALSQTPKLREMNFGDCLVRTKGACALADVLQIVHHDIEVVDLSFNEIATEGGVALATVLSQKKSLKRFNIDGNQFGEEGCEQVKDAMSVSQNPNALDDLNEDEGTKSFDEEEEDNDDDVDADENEKSTATAETNGNENRDDSTSNDTAVENEADYEDGEGEDGYWEDDETAFDEEEVEEEDSDEIGNDVTEEIDEEHFEDYTEDNNQSQKSTVAPAGKVANGTAKVTFAKTNGNQIIPASPNETVVPEDAVSPAEIFCLYRKPCTMVMFNNITGNKLEAIQSIFDLLEGDDLTLVMIFAALKCAHLSKNSTEAFNCAKHLFYEVFVHAHKIKQEGRILNHILTHAGLIHSETPFQPCYDIKCVQLALKEVLKSKFDVSPSIRQTLAFFLDATNNKKCNGIKV